ncbi:MAG: flagellar filament capping protein FliD, partial [Mobilitalea sp.]
FSLTEEGTADLSGLGLSEILDDGSGNMSLVSDGVDTNGDPIYKSTMVNAADAKITYNGAELTSASNTVIANGLTINLKGVTDATETISLSITDDTQAVYDMVKEFTTKYNELLKEMNEAYYADTAKGYDPLTDDERESMSDSEIEKWETKIKDSLLRRDDSLGSLLSTMKSKMSGTTNVNGINYSLASFGIGSTDYTEKGILHINGDADEDTVASKDNDLMTMLTTNPEAVMKTLNALSTSLYTSITKTMTSSSLRSALTVYNDKEITKTITNYKEDLDEEEERLTTIEDRYYSQFSAMETALAKINSQSSSLASMLGTS